MVVKTFRGLLADTAVDRIRLSTIKGKVGYRIVKFKLFPVEPGTTSYELVVKIYKTEQTVGTRRTDFTDSDLLAAAYLEGNLGNDATDALQVIFDQEIFNQDIYVTAYDGPENSSVNYYMELEVISLDDAGAEYTTLKDMRQT
jgi:hypothetical protein